MRRIKRMMRNRWYRCRNRRSYSAFTRTTHFFELLTEYLHHYLGMGSRLLNGAAFYAVPIGRRAAKNTSTFTPVTVVRKHAYIGFK